MCSEKSEHFLPHMWHPSSLPQITGNQSYVTVSEQTIQHNYVTQRFQICEQDLYISLLARKGVYFLVKITRKGVHFLTQIALKVVNFPKLNIQ